MPSIALPVSLRGQLLSGVRFSPDSLFVANEPGVWYDPSDVANLNWRRNLLTWTEQFDNAAWTKSPGVTVSANTDVAPDSTTTADTVTSGGNEISQSATCTVSTVYTDSVYFKKTSGAAYQPSMYLLFTGGTTVIYAARLNTDTGAATAISAGGFTAPSAVTVTEAGSYWRLSVSGSSSNNTSVTLRIYANMNSVGGTGAGTQVIWGAQLEVGSTATEYQRITDVNTEVIERFPTATLFQDTAGTTPVTTPGQTVALALDKSKGLVLGPELVTNGDFSNGSTGWTLGSGWAVTGGAAVKTAGISGELTTTIATTLTSFYLVTFTVANRTAGTFNLRFGSAFTNTVNISANGSYTYRIVPTSPGTTLQFSADGSFNGSIDNISVRELPGFHATQATAASRPTYGIVPRTGRRNLLTFTEQFDNAAWTKNNATITANAVVAPDGTTTADTITPNVTSGVHGVTQGLFATGITTLTASAYFKFAGYTNIAFCDALHSAACSAVVNIQDGTQRNVTGTSGTTTVTFVGNGWYRVAWTFTSYPSGAVNYTTSLRVVPNGTENIFPFNFAWSGDGTSGVHIWGYQFEVSATATAYQRVGSAFDVTEAGVPSLSYLSFDGVDDFLVTQTITPNIDKAQVFAGVRKLSDAATGIIVSHSPDATTNNGAFSICAPNVFSSVPYWSELRGTSRIYTDTGSFGSLPAPRTNVLSFLYDIGEASAVAELRARVNGSAASLVYNGANAGTGNFLAYPLYIGRLGGTSFPFNGQLYSLIVRFGANLDANTITNTETWVNGKTGAF